MCGWLGSLKGLAGGGPARTAGAGCALHCDPMARTAFDI